jgi:hypothetical protein
MYIIPIQKRRKRQGKKEANNAAYSLKLIMSDQDHKIGFTSGGLKLTNDSLMRIATVS